jgi:hypothetical protein
MFEDIWWSSFANAWNRGPYTHSLAGLGTVMFTVIRSPNPRSQVITFDHDGIASLGHLADGPEVPTFASTYECWTQFLQGDFLASEGLLRGWLTYYGPLKRILPFSMAFNNLGIAVREFNLLEAQEASYASDSE